MNIAERIILTPQEEKTIIQWSQGKRFPLRLIQRAQIIQLASQGIFNREIAKRLAITRPTVQLWRERFLAFRLAGLEKDAPRPGRLPKISHKKVMAIVNATIHTTPSAATHWSTRSMAKAHGVSKDSIQRIWEQYNLKPHLIKTFKLSRDKRFLEKTLRCCWALFESSGQITCLLCGRKKPDSSAGAYTTVTSHETRYSCSTNPRLYSSWYNNTFCSIKYARWHCDRGLHATSQTSGVYQVSATHRYKTPLDLDLHLIVDNYGTHKHPRVQKWLKRHPRFHLHFIPTSSSWLNMIERWFSEISTKRIRRGSFKKCERTDYGYQTIYSISQSKSKSICLDSFG